MPKILEVDVARLIVTWLESMGWDVYQEVQHRGNVADIVAVMNNRTWIIETKTSLNMTVLAQTDKWKQEAHWRSFAVPHARHREEGFVKQICSTLGMGWIELNVKQPDREPTQLVRPSLNRHAKTTIIKKLRPEHKTFAEAGNNQGRHWSEFRNTCKNVLVYVIKNPGCNLKQLVDSIDQHYSSASSARQCLSHWAQQGKISGVRVERHGKQIKFYPIEKIFKSIIPITCDGNFNQF